MDRQKATEIEGIGGIEMENCHGRYARERRRGMRRNAKNGGRDGRASRRMDGQTFDDEAIEAMSTNFIDDVVSSFYSLDRARFATHA